MTCMLRDGGFKEALGPEGMYKDKQGLLLCAGFGIFFGLDCHHPQVLDPTFLLPHHCCSAVIAERMPWREPFASTMLAVDWRYLVPTKLQILSSKWPFIRCDAISRCLSHRLPSCRWLCFFSSLRFLPKYDCYFIRLVFFLLPHFFLAQQNIITWSRIYTIEIQRCSMILSFLTLRLSPQIVGS